MNNIQIELLPAYLAWQHRYSQANQVGKIGTVETVYPSSSSHSWDSWGKNKHLMSDEQALPKSRNGGHNAAGIGLVTISEIPIRIAVLYTNLYL